MRDWDLVQMIESHSQRVRVGMSDLASYVEQHPILNDIGSE